jgi:starch phosphorylase
LNTQEVDELWRNGYKARDYYHRNPQLRDVIDRFYSPIGGQSFTYIADYLLGDGTGIADPFMCLADYEAYCNVYKKATSDFIDTQSWSKKSIINTAASGIFSSDNSIKKYADEIWHALPVNKSGGSSTT